VVEGAIEELFKKMFKIVFYTLVPLGIYLVVSMLYIMIEQFSPEYKPIPKYTHFASALQYIISSIFIVIACFMVGIPFIITSIMLISSIKKIFGSQESPGKNSTKKVNLFNEMINCFASAIYLHHIEHD